MKGIVNNKEAENIMIVMIVGVGKSPGENPEMLFTLYNLLARV